MTKHPSKGFGMRHKRTIFITILLAGLFGASVAFAAWSSTGSGSATAQTTTAANSVIAAGTSAADLYPGATMSVTVTISNPNPYPVLVNSISAGSSSALTSPTCAAGAVTTDARTDGTGLFQSNGSTKSIAAGGSGTYVLATHMIASPTDGCQTRTFALPLTATLSSNA